MAFKPTINWFALGLCILAFSFAAPGLSHSQDITIANEMDFDIASFDCYPKGIEPDGSLIGMTTLAENFKRETLLTFDLSLLLFCERLVIYKEDFNEGYQFFLPPEMDMALNISLIDGRRGKSGDWVYPIMDVVVEGDTLGGPAGVPLELLAENIESGLWMGTFSNNVLVQAKSEAFDKGRRAVSLAGQSWDINMADLDLVEEDGKAYIKSLTILIEADEYTLDGVFEFLKRQNAVPRWGAVVNSESGDREEYFSKAEFKDSQARYLRALEMFSSAVKGDSVVCLVCQTGTMTYSLEFARDTSIITICVYRGLLLEP